MGKDFFGDRFIPCRQVSNAYEMKFQTEEHHPVSSSPSFQSSSPLNPEMVESFDPVANQQTSQGASGTQQQQNSVHLTNPND
jgi:hypothetical protein